MEVPTPITPDREAEIDLTVGSHLEMAVVGIDRIFHQADLRLQWLGEQYRYDFEFKPEGIKPAIAYATHMRQKAEQRADETIEESNGLFPEHAAVIEERWSKTLQIVIFMGWALDKVTPRKDGEYWYDVIENIALGRVEPEEQPDVEFNPEGFGELVAKLTKDAQRSSELVDERMDFDRLVRRGNLYGIDRITPAKERIKYAEEQDGRKIVKRIVICRMLDETTPLADGVYWFDEIESRGRSQAWTRAT